MASSCRGCLQRLRRAILTLFVMFMMVGSLLVCSTPLLICILDVVLPWILLSSRLGYAYDLRVLWASYSLGSSLLDIPTISLLRSVIIICVYSVFDALGLSFGPYLWTTVFCGLVSGVLIVVKACLVMASSALGSPSAESGGFQLPWSVLEMLLLSIALALGHIVVAYRTRCKARRKMHHFQQLDPEAVPLYNTVFHGYQNLPCSPNPNMGRIVKANSEEKYFFDGGKHMPSRILPDDESLFMLCEGVVIHYKITNSHSYTSSAFHDSNGENYGSMLRRLRFDDPLLPRSHNLARKFSHTSTNEPLYTPLLSGSTTIEVNPSSKCGSNSYSGFFEHIPLLNLEKYKHDKFGLIEKLSEPTQYNCGRMGVILIHGFGGGVFSWRYVMNPLERQTGCTVAAFDRPGWGLTSCPSKSEWKVKGLPNLCELEFQVSLLSSFCQKLSFSSVVLIGHDDGGLLALMAAESLYKRQDISNVEVKGIVLVGAEDTLAQLKSAQASVSRIQNIRVVTTSKCGHLPHEECPTVLLTALVPFVSEVKMELSLKQGLAGTYS